MDTYENLWISELVYGSMCFLDVRITDKDIV